MKELIGAIIGIMGGLVFIIFSKLFAVKSVIFWNKISNYSIVKFMSFGKSQAYTEKGFKIGFILCGIAFIIFGLSYIRDLFK